ncbi:hypothetical protein L7F22_008567 [Adiantum nelumboides]|nr:hypothetical protein [Adiantum nelumboides]
MKAPTGLSTELFKGTDTYGVTTSLGATLHYRTNHAEHICFLNASVIGRDIDGCSLPIKYAKAAMLVRTNTLVQGYFGIRWDILDAMQKPMPFSGTITQTQLI